jgi:hypothetical protein
LVETVPRIRRSLQIAALALSAAAIHTAPALASATQESIFQDDTQLVANPVGTLQTLRDLGVQRVRVNVTWQDIAPQASSTHRPRGFTATDPAAYPASGWAIYDEIDRVAAADGVSLDFTLDGPAPLWATGSGAPRGRTGYFRADWEPSAPGPPRLIRAAHPTARDRDAPCVPRVATSHSGFLPTQPRD